MDDQILPFIVEIDSGMAKPIAGDRMSDMPSVPGSGRDRQGILHRSPRLRTPTVVSEPTERIDGRVSEVMLQGQVTDLSTLQTFVELIGGRDSVRIEDPLKVDPVRRGLLTSNREVGGVIYATIGEGRVEPTLDFRPRDHPAIQIKASVLCTASEPIPVGEGRIRTRTPTVILRT